ncbi:hypothetical protein EMPS_04689 [Entomortierella parvispora]|uniref:MSP domain-containing protein n=1 Tax=Entomortierella parvispora TaxID=205924 RepID=A0A9P3H9P5_9FUNG|nr:hypothetical protein EMPS_04689 [Entomortierella parvispora]
MPESPYISAVATGQTAHSPISSPTSNPTPSITSKTASSLLRVSPPGFQFSASKVMPGQFAKLKLENHTSSPVGFKFKTNAPMKYSVKPVLGVIPAGETIKISVRSDSWISPQDRFLLQSVSLSALEAENLTPISWKDLDRTRLSENYIPCLSSSALTLRDPEDDPGSISSSSSSTTSSSYTPPFRSLDWQPQQHHSRPSQVFERWQYAESIRPTVSMGGLSRRSSNSSAASSAPSSPGSYPTLFLSSTTSSCSTSPTSGQPPKHLSIPVAMAVGSSKGLFIPTTIQEEPCSPTAGLTANKASMMHPPDSRRLSRSKSVMDNAAALLKYHLEHSKIQLLVMTIACFLIWMLFPYSRASEL